MLLHLPRLAGHGDGPRMKNGPPLAGHGAEAVRDAITRTIITLPEELRRSLTWDQGTEMAQHERLKIDAGIQVYFCDPQSPWQRGTNENTNGLLRQYFPKGTDLSVHGAEQFAAVATAINTRPRKTLGWKTPAEALDEWLPTGGSPSAPTVFDTNRIDRETAASHTLTICASDGETRASNTFNVDGADGAEAEQSIRFGMATFDGYGTEPAILIGGTPYMLADLEPGPGSSTPQWLASTSSGLLFSYQDGLHAVGGG